LNRHERAFRRLVRLYPSAFRAEYEDQMLGLFADQLRDSRTSGDSLAVARLWAHVLTDLVTTAPQEHLRKDSPVLQPVEPTNLPAPAARSPLLRAVEIVASMPVVLLAALWALAPGYFDTVGFDPPAVIGLPLGIVIVAFAGCMAVFGWLVARRAQTLGVALGALAFLTIPASLLIVMTPLLILFLVETAGI
jgi:hypothetical protein